MKALSLMSTKNEGFKFNDTKNEGVKFNGYER